MPEAADARINNMLIVSIMMIIIVTIIIIIIITTTVMITTITVIIKTMLKKLQVCQIIVVARYVSHVPNPQHQCSISGTLSLDV